MKIGRRAFSLGMGSLGVSACTGSSAPETDGGLEDEDASSPTSADAAVGGRSDAAIDASAATAGLFARRTHTVAPSADGSGDGSPTRPWTMSQAMELASAGDIVGVLPGRYVGRQPQASIDAPSWREQIPAWAPANNGTADAPILFVAQYPAAYHSTDRSELYSGASYAGGARHGWPCFGTRAQTKSEHIQWIGFYSDEGDAQGHIDQDCGVATLWNAEHVTIAECHLVGDPDVAGGSGVAGEGGDNYSAIRLEGVLDATVRDNLLEGFYGGGGINNAGIILYGVDRLVAEHNHIFRCAHGIQPKGANYGLEMREMTIRLNHFEECVVALRLHRPTTNPGGPRSRIYQNLVEHTRFFIEVTTSSGMLVVADSDIFNNTIVHGRDGADPGCMWWASAPAGGGNRVFNNIFHDVDSYLGSYVADAAAIASFAAFDYNCVSVERSVFGGSSELRALQFDEWQAGFAQDRSSMAVDPQLDASYRPLAGSPCIDAGRDLPGLFGATDGPVTLGAFVTGEEEIGIRRS